MARADGNPPIRLAEEEAPIMTIYAHRSPWSDPIAEWAAPYEKFDSMKDVLEHARYMLTHYNYGPQVFIYKVVKGNGVELGIMMEGYITPPSGKFSERKSVILYETRRNGKWSYAIVDSHGNRKAIPKGWKASW